MANLAAIDAIEQSETTGQIVTIAYDREALRDLAAASDDNVQANDVYEFWKNDSTSEGMLWRVHVRLPRERDDEGDVLRARERDE